MSGALIRLVSILKVKIVLIKVIGVKEEYLDEYYTLLKNKYYQRRIEETAEAVGSDLHLMFDNEKAVNSKTVIGDNVHLIGINVRGEGRVTIGDNFHSGSGCEIITENHNYDSGDAIPYDDTFVAAPVEIGDNVWFGINVTVLPGVSIGEGAIIQAGSVVTQDIPKGAIAGGHPAAVFDHRDMEHYERLKAAGKFR